MSAPTVLILAAGQGTRMRSSRPKVLHELCGRPMICWPVLAAREAGAGRLVVVDSPAEALSGVLPADVLIAIQQRHDGTGGAVKAALARLEAEPDGLPETPVVVLAGDVPLVGAEMIRELVAAHTAGGALATIATTVLEDPSGYGRVVRGDDGEVERVVETKTLGDATQAEREIDEINTGIFVFAPQALDQTITRLTDDNAQGELYLPQVIDLIRSDGGSVRAHLIEDARLVLGVNDRAGLARVRRLAQDAINERHLLAGVTIVDPGATVIDVDVQIGADTVIEPFSSIRGATRIGEQCVVRHSYLVDCELQDGVSVGPFAYLRPGTVMRSGSKAGTFVEIKNSEIGERTKVPHLSYIGDADVGAGTNLGAATITANYDGHSKHRTKVGAEVRTSVDTTLVAPVELGDRAVTGAGSVITEDVPAGALGIARARQSNIEGYAERDASSTQAEQGEIDGGPAQAEPGERDGGSAQAEQAEPGNSDAGSAQAEQAESDAGPAQAEPAERERGRARG